MKLTYTRAELRKMKSHEYEAAIKVYMKETGKLPPARLCAFCNQPTPKECVCDMGQ